MAKESSDIEDLSDIQIVIEARINEFRQELIEAIKNIPIPKEHKVGTIESYYKEMNGFKEFRNSLVKTLKGK